jgi:hypothetical protein
MPNKIKIILKSVTGHIKYCVYVFSISIFLPGHCDTKLNQIKQNYTKPN